MSSRTAATLRASAARRIHRFARVREAGDDSRGNRRLHDPRDGFVNDGPAVIDIVVARQALSMPPKLTFEQIKECTLYASRTILSGRADEVAELAKTNVRDLRVE